MANTNGSKAKTTTAKKTTKKSTKTGTTTKTAAKKTAAAVKKDEAKVSSEETKAAETAAEEVEKTAEKPAKKAAPKKKAATKKATAKKTTAKKTTAKKAAAKEEVKEEPKAEVKEEVKAEVKEEPKAEVKEEVKAEVKEEPKAEAVKEVKVEVKEEPKAEAVEEVKAEIKEEPKAEEEVKEGPKPIKVLFCSPESVPFCGTGGLGDVAGSLPKALNRKRSIECCVILPLHKGVSQEFRNKMEFLGYKDIPVSWRWKYMGVFRLRYQGVTYFFIDNEEYFGRDALYGYFDDCERYTFFSRAVFESMEFTGFQPDIIHANDWQTAMVPILQDTIYKLKYTTTIFTIHNVEYQGRYGAQVFNDVLGLPADAWHLVEFEDDVNLMKGAIETANLVSTVSPTYALQLEDPFFAHGMENIVRKNAGKMVGILNGIDVKLYDPAKDPEIAANYDAKDTSGKLACKRALQKELGLPESDAPMLTMISRLVTHKGLDLVTSTIDGILDKYDCQLVLLGTGDAGYENFFRGLQDRHPFNVRSLITFDRALSHRIYAAGDILLMPSKSEPCGLSQMIGCRYGNAPLVRATGGLNDSIKDCTLGDGNGFVFDNYDSGSFYHCLAGAIERYGDKENWEKLVQHDLKMDFSWSTASKTYVELYQRALFK